MSEPHIVLLDLDVDTDEEGVPPLPVRDDEGRYVNRESIKQGKKRASSDLEDDVLNSGSRKRVFREVLKKEVQQLRDQLVASIADVDMLGARLTDESEDTVQASADASTLSAIRDILECPICFETLQRPFMLAPCGHTFCHGCLRDYFKNIKPKDGEPAELTKRNKACPSCSAVVRHRPAENYLIKAIISATGRDPSLKVDTSDPWVDVFVEEAKDAKVVRFENAARQQDGAPPNPRRAAIQQAMYNRAGPHIQYMPVPPRPPEPPAQNPPRALSVPELQQLGEMAFVEYMAMARRQEQPRHVQQAPPPPPPPAANGVSAEAAGNSINRPQAPGPPPAPRMQPRELHVPYRQNQGVDPVMLRVDLSGTVRIDGNAQVNQAPQPSANQAGPSVQNNAAPNPVYVQGRAGHVSSNPGRRPSSSLSALEAQQRANIFANMVQDERNRRPEGSRRSSLPNPDGWLPRSPPPNAPIASGSSGPAGRSGFFTQSSRSIESRDEVKAERFSPDVDLRDYVSPELQSPPDFVFGENRHADFDMIRNIMTRGSL